MKKYLLIFTAVTVLPVLCGAAPQTGSVAGDSSDPQAVKAMQQMLAALGGAKWLAIRNVALEGRTSSFYNGTPTGAIGDFYSLRTMPTSMEDPGLMRVDFTKKRNVVDILLKDQEWEVTYRGKRLVPPEEYKAVFLRRDHSLDEAVRVWWHQPGTILFWGGEKVSERHLVDEVTLLNADNDNITVQMDVDTHLPFRVSFTWRDPLYKDQNVDAEEYADYHTVDGFPTALNLSSYHNGEMTSQKYLRKAAYNVPVPPDTFDIDATTEKIQR